MSVSGGGYRRRCVARRPDALDRLSLQRDLFDEGVGDGVRPVAQPVNQALLLQGDDRGLDVYRAHFGAERGRVSFQRLIRIDSAHLLALVRGNAAEDPLRQRPQVLERGKLPVRQ